MKIVAAFLLSLPLLLTAAEPFMIYAPSNADGALLVVEAMPGEAGVSFELIEKIDLGSPVRSICAHPEKPMIYLTPAGSQDAVGVALVLNGDGRYERHTETPLVNGIGYVSLDRTNQFLLGSNYREGTVDVYRVNADGTIGEHVAGLDEGRKNAHCALITPDNRFLYIPYVKDTNGLFQYAFDEKSGTLTALDPQNANPPEGTGPRHIAHHPTKPISYFSNEQHVGVSAYDRGENGQLTLREVVDLVGANPPAEGVSSSDIVVTADGKYLFAGVRGHKHDFDFISRYQLDSDGNVTGLGVTKSDKIPWGLTLSPDGKYLLVAASEGGTLTVYAIGENGELAKQGSLDWGAKVTDLIAR